MFARRGDTASGFRAGIYLLIAVLCNWNGIIYTAMLCICVPLFSTTRTQRYRLRSAPRSNLMVVGFPAAATIFSIMVLDWVFLGSPVSILRSAVTYNPALWDVFPSLFTTRTGFVRLIPLLLLIGLAFIVKRFAVIPLGILVYALVLLSYVFGILPTNNAGGLFLSAFMISLATLIEANSVSRRRWVYSYWLVFAITGWIFSLNREPIIQWLSHLLG